ncbi:MAG TPA: cysteine peptidase family C39 domain-containing protein [Planctomycetota bacterium]
MRAIALLTSCLAGCSAGPWLAASDVPPVRQEQDVDCGAAALASLLAHWGISTSLAELREACAMDVEGIAAGKLREVVRAKGLEAYLIRATREDLEYELCFGRPVLVGLVRSDRTHYVLVTGVSPSHARLVDPAAGTVERSWPAFEREWAAAANLALVVFK